MGWQRVHVQDADLSPRCKLIPIYFYLLLQLLQGLQ
jgi:hypothetical protein